MYVCMFVFMCNYMYVCMYMYVCAYVCMYLCMYLCVYVCTYVCIYICICVYVFFTDNDTLIFIDFRADRMRQIVEAIGIKPQFDTDVIPKDLVS